jgi:hypothetical protein
VDRNELLADVAEALDLVKEWKPVYVALLKSCRNKEEALDALKFLIKMKNQLDQEESMKRAA